MRTLEEVREHFKDAKEVKSLFGAKFFLKDVSLIHIPKESDEIYYNCGEFQIYSPSKGYAKIISYKEPQFTLTKSQLTELHNIHDAKPLIEKWFNGEFTREFNVGDWVKTFGGGCFKIIAKDKNVYSGYGTLTINGRWYESWAFGLCSTYGKSSTLATPKEVEEALIWEAKKRGFKEGVICNNSNIHNLKVENNVINKNKITFLDGNLYMDYTLNCFYQIFKDGTWATIIEEPKLPSSLQTAIDEIGKEQILKLLKKC